MPPNLKCVAGIYLPEADEHFAEHLEKGPVFRGKPTYQLKKLEKAMEYVKRYRHAVDIGAHVGLWAMVLRSKFKTVTAFEPIEEHIACFEKNLESRDNVILHKIALGEEAGEVRMSPVSANSGNAHVSPRGRRKTEIKRLDDFSFQHLDFVKIDVEGFEVAVIKGGEKTLRHFKPVIVIEQKPGNAERFGYGQTEALELLKSWGAKEVWEKSGDHCLTW